MKDGGLRILLSGTLAGAPGQGGLTWVVLQYLLGLRALGHQVCFLESIADDDLIPAGSRMSASENAAYLSRVARYFDFGRGACLMNRDSGESFGMEPAELREFSRDCDLLLNLSGLLPIDDMTRRIPVRAFVDLDPGFTQLWQLVEGLDIGLEEHTHHVSIGLSIGRDTCPVPTGGREWIKTPQPVFLPEWPVSDSISHDALTTIAHWRGYGSMSYEGRFYGQKAHSLRPLFSLPDHTPERFVLALGIHPGETEDLRQLRRFGWELADPSAVAGSPEAFRRFVQESKAEFGIAKSGYVEANCGWFSDRSICYLASGRPVIAQETGFSEHLPTGKGLLSFSDEEDVLQAIGDVNSNYEAHREAARSVAESCFDSNIVLPRLLRKLGFNT